MKLTTFIKVCAGMAFGCGFEDERQAVERVGIIGAMDDEVALLKEAMTIEKVETIADMEFVVGALGNHEVVVVKCGMGKVNAGICAHSLIHLFHATRIINIGVAGSLDARLHIGDLVLSTDAVQHDYDVSPIDFQKGEIPYTGLISFPADETLLKRVKETATELLPELQVVEGRICSGDQFIADSKDKDRIVSMYGGLCCEMEGGAIAQTCYLNHVPFVIVRAISDNAEEKEGLTFAEYAPIAAQHSAKLIQALIESGI